jgi:hypothetical protein
VITLLLTYPALPLGTLMIVAIYLLLSRGLRKAEDSDNETLDALVADMEATQAKFKDIENRLSDHGNKLTKLALRGVK